MITPTRVGAFLLVLVSCSAFVDLDGAAAADDPQAVARKARLKVRTREWLEARRSLLYRSGRRVRVSRASFYKLYYDLHSPAWRARLGEPETLEPTLRAMNAGKGRPPPVARFAVVGAELVSDRFGIGRYKANGIAALREVRWVWVEGGSARRGDWYLYGGDVDGRWGERTCDPSPATRRSLDKADAESLTKLLNGLELAHSVHSVAAAGRKDVVVVLAWAGVHGTAKRGEVTRRDAIQVARAVLAGDKRWTGVRLAFMADWMDRFGRVVSRPHLHACMDRATFDQIVFANLSAQQIFALFHTKTLTHAGLSLRVP